MNSKHSWNSAEITSHNKRTELQKKQAYLQDLQPNIKPNKYNYNHNLNNKQQTYWP